MAGATQERRLLGVGFRVEPVVTHPAPPDPDVRKSRNSLVHHFTTLPALQMLWTILSMGSA
jgi:hypothetical protein